MDRHLRRYRLLRRLFQRIHRDPGTEEGIGPRHRHRGGRRDLAYLLQRHLDVRPGRTAAESRFGERLLPQEFLPARERRPGLHHPRRRHLLHGAPDAGRQPAETRRDWPGRDARPLRTGRTRPPGNGTCFHQHEKGRDGRRLHRHGRSGALHQHVRIRFRNHLPDGPRR